MDAAHLDRFNVLMVAFCCAGATYSWIQKAASPAALFVLSAAFTAGVLWLRHQ